MVDLSSAVISSDFPLVLFVRHQVDGRKRTGGEAPTVSLHCEEYQLLEIQRVREPRERNWQIEGQRQLGKKGKRKEEDRRA